MISTILLEGTTVTMTISEASNTEVFRTNVEKVLCQAIRRGEIIVMDNRGTHKKLAPWPCSQLQAPKRDFSPPIHQASLKSGKCGAN